MFLQRHNSRTSSQKSYQLHYFRSLASTSAVKINFNMLCALVLYMVSGEVDDADVVVVDKCAPAQRTLKLLK
jgi:hypothetical protein